MSGAHSALEPRLPIPNRTVKRGRADDSVHAYAKVGQCQTPSLKALHEGFFLPALITRAHAIGAVSAPFLRLRKELRTRFGPRA